jgi:YebC/PmpR family DNA-binding regulatory protein
MGAQWKQKGREAAANAKGRVMSRLTREIMIAARDGADPAMNPRLRMAVEAARKASMSRDTMERAIKKGAGLLNENVIVFETVTYEGFTPHQVPVVVECLTDNRNRTSANIKAIFRKGQIATSGAVTWDFARLGAVDATAPAKGDDPDEAAIECGAQDLEANDEGGTTFFTEPTELDTVSKALAERGWTLTAARLIWKAKNPVSVDDDAKRAEVETFLERPRRRRRRAAALRRHRVSAHQFEKITRPKRGAK